MIISYILKHSNNHFYQTKVSFPLPFIQLINNIKKVLDIYTCLLYDECVKENGGQQKTKTHTQTHTKYKLFIFIATLLWGSSFFVHKTTMLAFTPISLVTIRHGIAFLALLFFIQKKLKLLNKSYWIAATQISIVLFAGNVASSYGLVEIDPGKNAFLTAVYCIIVPFIAWFAMKKRPHTAQFLAAFVCIIGIGFVSLKENLTIGKGDFLSLVSGVIFAIQIVMLAQALQDKEPILLTLLIFGMNALFGWLTMVLAGIPVLNGGATLTFGAFSGLIYLSIPVTMIAFILQNTAQKYVNPSSASLILSLEAVFGVIFSIIFYNERLTIRLICGFALIFLAILISETKLSFLTRTSPNR